MDIIEELFSDANVVGTRDVARAFNISETDAREWAEELDVAKIGASFAWSRVDVARLSDALDEDDEDEDEEDADDLDEDADDDDEDVADDEDVDDDDEDDDDE